jgi:hypothetical protein
MALEEPGFTLVAKEGAFELRDYAASVVAEVAVTGSPHSAGNKGFRLLAGYIFGANSRAQKIAMTVPVTKLPAGEQGAMTAPVTQTSGASGHWLVRFTLPRAYALSELPMPESPQVQLRDLPAQRFAVLRFSGLTGEERVAAQSAELTAIATARGLVATGPVALARYNPPWTPWFLRRNEVMFPVGTA